MKPEIETIAVEIAVSACGLVTRSRIGSAVLLVALALSLPVSTAIAADDQPVLGHGNVTCRAWSDERQNPSSSGEPRTAWVLGFITAYSQYGGTSATDVSRGKSTEEIVAAIDRHCGDRPRDTLHKASSMLVETLSRQPKP